eukprot:396755_1
MSKADQNYNGCAPRSHDFIRSDNANKIFCRKCDDVIAGNCQAMLKKILKKDVIDDLKIIEDKISTIAFARTKKYSKDIIDTLKCLSFAQTQNYTPSFINHMDHIINEWIQVNAPINMISDQHTYNNQNGKDGKDVKDFKQHKKTLNELLSNAPKFINHRKNGFVIGKLLSLHIEFISIILTDYCRKIDGIPKSKRITLRNCINIHFVIKLLSLDIEFTPEALEQICGALQTLGISDMIKTFGMQDSKPNYVKSLDHLYQILKHEPGLDICKNVLRGWEYELDAVKEDINGEEELKKEIPEHLYTKIKALLANINDIINLYKRLLTKLEKQLGVNVVFMTPEVKEDVISMSADVNQVTEFLSHQIKHTQKATTLRQDKTHKNEMKCEQFDSKIKIKIGQQMLKKNSKYMSNKLIAYLKVYKKKQYEITEKLKADNTLTKAIVNTNYATIAKNAFLKGYKKGTKSNQWLFTKDEFINELKKNIRNGNRRIEEVAEIDEYGNVCIKMVWMVKVNFKDKLYDIGVEVDQKYDRLIFTALYLKIKGRESEFNAMDNLCIVIKRTKWSPITSKKKKQKSVKIHRKTINSKTNSINVLNDDSDSSFGSYSYNNTNITNNNSYNKLSNTSSKRINNRNKNNVSIPIPKNTTKNHKNINVSSINTNDKTNVSQIQSVQNNNGNNEISAGFLLWKLTPQQIREACIEEYKQEIKELIDDEQQKQLQALNEKYLSSCRVLQNEVYRGFYITRTDYKSKTFYTTRQQLEKLGVNICLIYLGKNKRFMHLR